MNLTSDIVSTISSVLFKVGIPKFCVWIHLEMVELCIQLWVTLTLTLTFDFISYFFGIWSISPILQITFLK